ncbi:hypothetical protein B0H63DRAFT_144952 [Podospora didyma]|uniref:BSD domain-containing protein n=1 Tax=Podospora didyma TaxID=330526 RepID=A0AAE0U140_9PEZI|nr:hypothetical protein B0H63DRAFT_144952 [Podospora didyma]
MAIPKGLASYKKKDGILTLTPDETALIWTPLPGTGPPVVSLAVDRLKNLQRTPETAPKVILKVFEKPRTPEGDPIPYAFTFTSPADARGEANVLKDVLSEFIKANQPGAAVAAAAVAAAAPADGSAGNSAAMSFANAVIARQRAAAIKWFDDDTLKSNTTLQESLMKKDASLAQMYADARTTKPDSVTDTAFNAQFWDSRVGLLRAHAIELNQKKGAYNILSTVKPRAENGELRLNMTPEQAQMILQQHPLVQRIYNENTPKLSETDFWCRFFNSKLCKRLRGERVTELDHDDVVFDRYNEADNSLGFATRIMAQHVPHMIDLEANEENQGGGPRSGNRKDVEMRPRHDVPIIMTLNSLSEKIMANVAPTDIDEVSVVQSSNGEKNSASGAAPANGSLGELMLRDLRGDVEVERIILNVKENNQMIAAQNGKADNSEEAKIYSAQVPEDVLFEISADIETLDDDGSGGLDLHKSIGVDDDSDSDREADGIPGAMRMAHVGSRAARKQAQDQILSGMRTKRAEALGGGSEEDPSPMNIPADITQRCNITNATTTEFLRQFWHAFMSGDKSRANEVAYHAESLAKSAERIHALAAEAEMIRSTLERKRKQEIRDYYTKTGKKARWVPIGGGQNSVLALFEATLTSLNVAQTLYKATTGWEPGVGTNFQKRGDQCER